MGTKLLVMRRWHTRYIGIYCILVLLVALAFRAVPLSAVPDPILGVSAALSALAFVPMKLCFRPREFLSLGRMYFYFLGAGVACIALLGLHCFSDGPAEMYALEPGLMLSSTAFFLYYLHAREVLRRLGH